MAGIAVAAIGSLPILQKLGQQSQVLTNEQIQPGTTKTITLDVSDASKQITAVISTTDSNAPLRAILKAPDTSVLADSTFRSNTVLNSKPTTAGLYALAIYNEGGGTVTVNAILGYAPGSGNNQDTSQLFAGAIAGGLMMVVGIIVVIIGVIIAVMDRRPKSLPSSAA